MAARYPHPFIAREGWPFLAAGVLLSLEPQAVRLSAAATPRIPIEAVVLRIRLRPSRPVVRRQAAPVYVLCANI